MKQRVVAVVLSLCLLLPVTAGAAQEQAVCGYPTEQAMQELPKTVKRGEFLEALAIASGEDPADSAWIDMTGYFVDGAEASDGVKWAFAKWVLNGDGKGEDLGILRLDDTITRQEAAAFLGRYLDYRYTELPAGCGTGSPSMDNIADWAQRGVMQCWLYGVIDTKGMSDFRPNDLVSGEEAADWITNANAVTASAYWTPEAASTFTDALVRAVETEGNWALSPYSARLCLAMLANGAKGETQAELLDALRINDLDAFNQSVREQLKTYDGYARIMSLDTANSIWLNQSWFDGNGAFQLDFAEKMGESYRATVEEVTNEDSIERVNAWVNKKTNGKIPSILTEENRKFVTALVNAVYFKAAWENEFPENRTEQHAFANADGTISMVDMMHQTSGFGYYATPGVEVLKMDYRKYAVDNAQGDNWEYFRDADFSMYLIQADKNLDVQYLLDQAEFVYGDVAVSVPKFKVEYGAALDDALQVLGVKAAYDPKKADLTAMLDPTGLPGKQHFLDTVLQKAYISVNEKGTEAAAVTAAANTGGSAGPTRPQLVREFNADRPFWFVIRDNANGEILFVGQYKMAQ